MTQALEMFTANVLCGVAASIATLAVIAAALYAGDAISIRPLRWAMQIVLVVIGLPTALAAAFFVGLALIVHWNLP